MIDYGSKPVTRTFEIVAITFIGMDAGLNGKQLCGMNNLNEVTSFFPPCPSGMHCLRRTETFKGKTYFFGVCEQNVIEGGQEIEDGNDAIEMRGSYGPRIISDGEGNVSIEIAI